MRVGFWKREWQTSSNFMAIWPPDHGISCGLQWHFIFRVVQGKPMRCPNGKALLGAWMISVNFNAIYNLLLITGDSSCLSTFKHWMNNLHWLIQISLAIKGAGLKSIWLAYRSCFLSQQNYFYLFRNVPKSQLFFGEHSPIIGDRQWHLPQCADYTSD